MGYSNKDNHQQALCKKKMNLKTRRNLISGRFFKVKRDVRNVVISKHMEGFPCSAHKYQHRNCHKFGPFSTLCYKKQESYKKRPRSPKIHQLTSGRLSTQNNSICSHSSDNSSSGESFCLQMKVQGAQANANVPAPKHLFTNLEFKVKPHKTKTKFL